MYTRHSFRLLFALIIATNPLIAQVQNAKDILSKTIDTYQRYQSTQYTISYLQKYFDDRDTIKLNGQCILVRESNDTLFGGYVYLKTNQGDEKLYDLKNIYVANEDSNSIMLFDAHDQQEFAITGNTSGEMINIFFLKPNKLKDYILNKQNKVELFEKHPKSNTHHLIKISMPNDGEFTNFSRMLWINKQTSLIDKMNFQAQFQQQIQYNQWDISYTSFDSLRVSNIIESFHNKTANYRKEKYEKPGEEYYELLSVGTVAPNFTMTNILSDKKIESNDLLGNIIILDFFYKACHPCHKMIPTLKNIHTKFSDKGVLVLALNSKDNKNELTRKDLNEYLTTNTVSYPVMYIDPLCEQQYKVKVFPSLYIIGRDGKIAYSHLGYEENIEEILSKQIERLLK